MCYKILAKFLARLRQESCMILEDLALVMIFITLESTALSLSCLTLKADLYFYSYKNNTTVFFQDLTRTCKKLASFLFLLRKIVHNLIDKFLF